jgi:hypothetical protein
MSKKFNRGISQEKIIKKAQYFFEKTDAGKAICDGVLAGELFVCIRDNYFNVYRNGCALLKFNPNASKHKFLVHKKYWHQEPHNIDLSDKNYLSLMLDENRHSNTRDYIKEIIKSPNKNLEEYLTYKNKKSESEKELLQAYLTAEKPCLIDLEVAFSCKNTKAEAERDFVAKRIDLAVLEKSDSGVTLRFIEAKVVSDSRLRAEIKDPEVIEQLKLYDDFLNREPEAVLESYKRIAKNYVDNFSYLIPKQEDRSLMKGFYLNGELDEKPSLLLLSKTGGVEQNMQGTNGKNNGNHYKTLKCLCDGKWELYEWIQS